MVTAVRAAEKALGKVQYEVTEREKASRIFRKSLFVVRDMEAGDAFTSENVRAIRPGHGLHTRYLQQILGRKAKQSVKRGAPLYWGLVLGSKKGG